MQITPYKKLKEIDIKELHDVCIEIFKQLEDLEIKFGLSKATKPYFLKLRKLLCI